MASAGKLAGALARQRHDVLHAVQVLGPCLAPLLIERALLGGGDQRLVDLAGLVDARLQRGEALLGGFLALGGVLHQVQAQRDAQLVDVGAKRAERTHARQPALRDLDGVGIDTLHGADRHHADAGEREHEDRQHGQKLEDDRQLRHHRQIPMIPSNAQITCAAIVTTDGRAEVSSTMLAGFYPVRLRS